MELRRQYPRLRIAGLYSPPFGPFSRQEDDKMVGLISSSGARYLFMGVGSPKQEFWIRDHLHRLGVSVAVGVGGLLKCLAGDVKRAPVWVQNLGGEWLVRMAQRPQLARRYFVDDLPVLFKLPGYKLARERSQHSGRQDARTPGRVCGHTDRPPGAGA